MSELIRIITSPDPAQRNRPLDAACRECDVDALLAECHALEQFRKTSTNLYERVRALFFLSAIYRYHLPFRPGVREEGAIPFEGYQRLLSRRFEEALRSFLGALKAQGPSVAVASALSAAYRGSRFKLSPTAYVLASGPFAEINGCSAPAIRRTIHSESAKNSSSKAMGASSPSSAR